MHFSRVMHARNELKYLTRTATKYTLQINSTRDSFFDLFIDKSEPQDIREKKINLIKENRNEAILMGTFYIINDKTKSTLKQKNTIYKKEVTHVSEEFEDMCKTNTDIVFTLLSKSLQSRLTNMICFYKYKAGSPINFYKDIRANVAFIYPDTSNTTIFRCDALDDSLNAEVKKWIKNEMPMNFTRSTLPIDNHPYNANANANANYPNEENTTIVKGPAGNLDGDPTNGGRRTRARKSKTRKGKARKSKSKRTRKH